MQLTQADVGLPADYGLPSKFQRFRSAQLSGLTVILSEELGLSQRPRMRGVQMPVGSGKTGYFMTLDAIRRAGKPNMRTAILTMTKPQQQQILKDFAELGIVDIRGRGNYSCEFYDNCETGADHNCSYARSAAVCPYFAQFQTALDGRIVLTNLAYWIAIHRYGDGLGPFDLLIVDEAHSLLSGLTDASSSTWPPTQGPQGEFNRVQMSDWIEWAKEEAIDQAEKMRWMKGDQKKARERLLKLQQLADANEHDFVADVSKTGWASINPVWPADHAEDTLYQGIPEVLLLSGTLLAKTMELVGAAFQAGRASSFEAYPLDPDFKPQTWPINLVDCGRIQHDMSGATRSDWVNAHARIAAHFHAAGLPGIVHTVSYTRAAEVAKFLPSKLGPLVVTHAPGGENVQEAISRYKAQLRLGNPAILVSPAVSTGYDFPEAPANYSIISKMPRQDFTDIPNLRNARRARDRDYVDYEMMMAFWQSTGRGKRSAGQVSHVFVLDSHARYLLANHKSVLSPEWGDSLLVWGKKGVASPVLPRL